MSGPTATITQRLRAAIRHLAPLSVALACAVPVWWMVVVSLRSGADPSANPVPWPLTGQNYTTVFATLDMPRLLLNTAAVSTVTAAGQLLLCLLAGYGLAMWDFRGRDVFLLAFVGIWLVPFQVSMIPNYLLLSDLGLLNRLPGVVVPNLCSALAVLMLRQHMLNFPRALVEAARVDGRSSWGALWTVVVPNLAPALGSLGILLFVTAWNDYLWPSLVLQRSASVVQLGIRGFLGPEGNDWGAVMAASTLACLPTFALYLVLRRRMAAAFIHSGVR